MHKGNEANGFTFASDDDRKHLDMPRTHTHTHTHVHTHTYTHAHTRTHTHTLTHKCAQKYTHETIQLRSTPLRRCERGQHKRLSARRLRRTPTSVSSANHKTPFNVNVAVEVGIVHKVPIDAHVPKCRHLLKHVKVM